MRQSTVYLTKPLRKCRVCGLEAWTEEDLEKFCNDKGSKHGKRNVCNECTKKYNREYAKKHPLIRRYRSMIQRCYIPSQTSFHNYGGRGITVCDEWRNDREAFYTWAKENGFNPELELERINNAASYSPENCTWVTHQQQALNRRTNTTNFEKGTRICYKCKEEKLLSEFYKSRHKGSGGHRFICKRCIKSENRKNYLKRKARNPLIIL